MYVIQPVSITPDKVTTNVPLTSVAAYDGSKTYAADDKVLYGYHIWRSVSAGNVGNTPGVVPTNGVARWVDTGAQNAYLMFDKKVGGNIWNIGLYTANPNVIDVKIKPGQVVNSIALFGLQASSVKYQMLDETTNPATVIKEDTIPMADVNVNDWWDYFFKPFDRKQSIVIEKLPSYGNATIRLIITNPGAEARVGYVAMGQPQEIGDTEYGTTITREKYSINKTDEFGNRTLIVRGSSRVVGYKIVLPTNQVSSKERLLTKLEDTPSVYVGTSDIEVTITLGLYKSFNQNLENWGNSSMSLDVTSLES